MDSTQMRRKRKAILDRKRRDIAEEPLRMKRSRHHSPLQDITNSLCGDSSSTSHFSVPQQNFSLGSTSSFDQYTGPSTSIRPSKRKSLPQLPGINLNLANLFDNVAVVDGELSIPASNSVVDTVVADKSDLNVEFCQVNCDFASTLSEEDWELYSQPVDIVDYEDLGDPVFQCRWCGSKFWRSEALRCEGGSDNPTYSLCCGKGKVQLPFMADPPLELHNLFFGRDDLSNSFLDNIRLYNSSFAFFSMGGKIDRSVNRGGGRFSFRLSGQNYHRIGSLLPVEGQSAKFAQLYIFDTQNETHNRMSIFSDGSAGLDESILEKLKDVLDTHNVLARSFRMARDRYESGDCDRMQLRLVRSRNRDGRTYNLPTVDEVAGLIVGDFETSQISRDIIIEHQSGQLQRIDELHPSYLALQYPFLFPYGEDGFREDILHSELSNPENQKQTKVTMRQFFAFRLQERDFEVSVILYAKRLLQQFIVDGYTMIESSRLRYVRLNQKKLRADLYRGVVDAVSRGVGGGQSVGKRIVLPASFTGVHGI